MKAYLDKVGSFGSVITAAACPACFPQLAAFGTLVGLGALSSYEGAIFLATKVLVAIAMAGHVLAYLFLGMYVFGSESLIYAGLLAMLAASVTDLVRRLRIRRRLTLRTTPE